MIKTDKLSRVYRTEDVETTALNSVDVEIKEGEFVAIMGPSGCGKSTLLNILGLLDTPSSGEYYLDGTAIHPLREKQRSNIRKENIGFIFQSFNLIDELTVFENVELPLVYLKKSKSEREEKVNAILGNMGIAHRAKHYPQQLSGGQQQRVAVARAVINSPKIILADEPTGNLDSAHGNEVMETLTKLHESGSTIIMVTHSRHDANYAERIIKLHDGSVVSELESERISLI